MRVFVIGSALREVCRDQAALGLIFLEEGLTAPRYRLYSIGDTHAALVEDTEHGVSVPGELVEIPDARWDEILASEPQGVTQAPVELADGRVVSGAFVDVAKTAAKARDISEFGGFAAYLRAHAGRPRARNHARPARDL